MIALVERMKAFIFVFVINILVQGPKTTLADEIRYPGDLVTYTGEQQSQDFHPELSDSNGYVIRVVNTSYHNPPVLVSWNVKNYSVSWMYPENLTLASRSDVADWQYNFSHCKQAQSQNGEYASKVPDIAKIGLLFRSLIADETFWMGDVCIYLGIEVILENSSQHRLWCFRPQSYALIDSFENLQILGVTNYPGVYEYSINNQITGFYRYPVVNKYSATIQYDLMLKGFENSANLTLDCSGNTPLSVKAYPSRVLANDNTQITVATAVPAEQTFTTKWITKYSGPNYMQFVIDAGKNHKVKIGIWYNVIDPAKHDIKIEAPGTDTRFSKANNPVTITQTRSMKTSAFLAYVYCNDTISNETQYGITDSSEHAVSITYKDRGVHDDVLLMVWNKLSMELTEVLIFIAQAFEIQNVRLTSDPIVKTNEPNLKFYLNASGGYGSLCTITYGDGESSTFETTLSGLYNLTAGTTNATIIGTTLQSDPGLQHEYIKNSSYRDVGFYNVTVTCVNEINSASYSTIILAEDPIVDLQLFAISPHQFGKPIEVVWSFSAGTNVTVDILYNEMPCNSSGLNIPGQNNSLDCLVTNVSYFDPDYMVDIKIRARNLVSNKSSVTVLQILEPMVITHFVALTTVAPWGSGVSGQGPKRNKFPAEHPVLFKANFTGGPPSGHGMRYHYGTWIEVAWNAGARKSNYFVHQARFQTSDDKIDATLILENAAQELWSDPLSVDLDRSFSLATVSIESPVVRNRTENITINLGCIGAHTCMAVDFGDNSSLLLFGEHAACERDYGISSSRVIFSPRNESTTRIDIEHVFKDVGTYQFKIKGKNYVSSGSFQKEVVVQLEPCQYPNVTITGLNDTDSESLLEHQKSKILSLTTENMIDCELTQKTRIKWSLYKLVQNPRQGLKGIESIPRIGYKLPNTINLTLPVLVLDGRSLEYGFYAVTARLEMDGYPDIFTNETKYFRVVATPFLEPAVTTGFIYTVIFREMAVLNASATVDPDFEHPHGITYQWFCRDKNDTEKFGPDFDQEPLRHIPKFNDTFPPPLLNSTGCFGKGRGRLNSTNIVLEMDSMFMIEGKTYIITLVASKVDPVFGLRRTAMEIFFQVAIGLPPSLKMTCLKNCQEKVNPDEKMTTKATCTTRCYGQLAFKWRLYWFDSVNMPEPFELTELNEVPAETLSTMVTNPVDELELAFKPNTLKPGRKYILQLKATRPNEVFGELRHTMIMNSAPNGGECSIHPKAGVAMTTTFNITCKNWTDTDAPILYEYAYKINDVKTVFFSATARPFETVVSLGHLPIGDPNRDNDIDIYINIKDTFEGASVIHFIVKVDPPSLSSMDSMLSDESLSSMIEDGDPRKALAMAGVFASVLNHIDGNSSTSGNLTAEEQAKRNNEGQRVDELKQTIMKSLIQVKVEDMNTLLMMSGTTQALTDNAEKLSPRAQEYGLMLNNISVTSLTELSKGKSSFKDVDSAVTNLANTIGQLLAAATKPREDQNNTMGSDDIGRAQKSISMISNLHEAKLRYLVTNEGPSTSKSKHLTLQSEKVSIRNMGKTGNSANNCSFKTPSPEVFGFGEIVKDINATISQLDSVTIKVGVFNNNPYTWDNTSKTVTSKIASLDLTSSKEIQLSNLTEDIAITISRDPSQFPTMNSFYMKPDKPQPDDVGKSYLKYHCFNRTSRWTAMNFELHPEDVSLSLKVYLKTGGKPSVRNGDFNLQYDLPDFTSCDLVVDKHNTSQDNETVVIDPFSHCTRHPYSLFISNVDFNKTGEHCFGVYVQNASVKNDPNPASATSRRKRSFACDIGKRRMRRSCVIIPPPPPKPPTESPFKVLFADNLGFDGQYFFPNQTPNYNMTMFESSCLYWDEKYQNWTGHGCHVGPLTSRTSIQCFCNHLTSFGGDLVVAPNPIDFNSVFNNFGSLQDNVAVLALISTVLGLYILGVLWGRRADKRDKLMTGPTILPNPHGCYHYLVTLYTGNRQGSGTTAKVFFKMVGDDDETVPVKLWDAKRPCFERGQENQFIASYPQEVGELNYVQIWHNNAGMSPSWYLSRISVKDIQTNKQWYFVCDNWLAVEAEDGKVCRVLPVANDQELTNFNQLFTARTVKGLADGHLWFSIFSRPPSSNFTRVQRLSCCLCLLCCTMITSAMFYNMGGNGPSPFAIHIGSLVIDLKQFVIALQSSLIIVPVNVAIVQIFRNLRPKPRKEDIYSEETEEKIEKKGSAEEKPKGKLPYWFIYIAYLLCYLASAASIFFTLLYSIQWGKEKSTEWVIAMVTAFLQSVLLLQPVKVLVLAIVLAVFVRKPADTDDQDDTPVIYEPPQSVPKTRRKRAKRVKIYSPPDPETLKEARDKRLKEIKMNSVIKEIAAFFIFLIMLLNVAYYHRDPNTFLMTKTLYETFDEVDSFSIDLGAVSDGDSLWMWTRETLVPGLYAKDWYNGKAAQKGFIANMEDYLVGVPRLRLVRVKKDSCKVDKLFEDRIPHCYDAFSLANEEDETFGVSWKPLGKDSARKRRDLTSTPLTEEEWLERMFTRTKEEDADSRTTKTGETMPSVDALPENLLPKDTLAQRISRLTNVQQNKRDKYASRQKRAVDPITSSVTGKNRRKKKRLLGSDKPKVYAISDQALLPNGKIMSCFERWRHQSTSELRGFPYWGAISLYSGGGYAANLGYDSLAAYTVISDLHSNGWIDAQTRAIFVEFTVYNANTNLFGIISIMIEFPSSSAAFTKTQFQSARFYLHLNGAETLSHILVIFFMLYFLYREGKLVYKQRWSYFKGFWNWVETILVVCEFMTIVLFLARLYEVDRNLLQLRENPNDYVPFQYAAGADAALCYILGILVFFYTIRFLRLLRFNKNFANLGKTISRISGPILGFCIPFFFAFLAFGMFAFTLFGTNLHDYSTFQMTMVTQFSMTLGDFDFEALAMTNPLLGPLYFFGFVGLNIFILMNVFLAIINDSYAEVQEEEAYSKNEYEILEYISEQIQLMIRKDPKKCRKAKRISPKKTKQSTTEKPRYVTFQETKKKLYKTDESLQENEKDYRALYENLFVEMEKGEESQKNQNSSEELTKEDNSRRVPSGYYSTFPTPNFTPGVNVTKLDCCAEQLESFLAKLHDLEQREIQTTEDIENVPNDKQQDICFGMVVFIEAVA